MFTVHISFAMSATPVEIWLYSVKDDMQEWVAGLEEPLNRLDIFLFKIRNGETITVSANTDNSVM